MAEIIQQRRQQEDQAEFGPAPATAPGQGLAEAIIRPLQGGMRQVLLPMDTPAESRQIYDSLGKPGVFKDPRTGAQYLDYRFTSQEMERLGS